MVNLYTEYVETISENYGLNIGQRLLIAAESCGQLEKYIPYKPADKYDCRKAFGEGKATKSYWEANSQGASDISVVGIDDLSPQSIENLITSIDNYQYDILAIPGLYTSNLEGIMLLDDFIIKSSILGNGMICILSSEERNKINYTPYVNDIISKIELVRNKVKYPKYFSIVSGDIIYNYGSKFQYTTDATATFAGLLASYKAPINSTRKPISGIRLEYDYTGSDVNNLLSSGYVPVIYTSNYHQCISRGNTLDGNGYFHVSHVRVANVVNQSVGNQLKQYIGNSINIINIRNTVSNVLEYYKASKYYRQYDYDIVNSSYGEITVNIRLLPNDVMNIVDTTLKVVLQKV